MLHVVWLGIQQPRNAWSHLKPSHLGNRGTLGLKWASPAGVYIRNSRKGLSHDARSMSVLMGWAYDLAKLKGIGVSFIKQFIISQIVPSLLIHSIQQSDASLTN